VRAALISDVHGNPIALEAVLTDVAAQGGVDEHWLLGDFAAIGHAPVAALERAARLPNARFLRGNTDRYLATGALPPPTPDQVRADPALLGRALEVAKTFAWTQGALAATGWLGWLDALPVEHRLTLPDGTRVLLVHAAPGTDDGRGVRPDAGDEELAGLVAGQAVDLVCVGHTHWPVDRTVDGVRVVNLGATSNSYLPGGDASYAMLDADGRGYRLWHRRVPYDHGAVLAALDQVRHPAAAFIARFQRGEVKPPWVA